MFIFMAHTGKAGCKLIFVCCRGWWNSFLLHISPSFPFTSMQLYEMPQTTQAMGQTSSMLAETKLRMAGPELWCSMFSCLPMWSWARHSSVLLFSACSCFQCLFSFCGRGMYVGVFEEYHELCKGEKFCRWNFKVSLHPFPWTPKVEFLTT